MKTQLLIYPQQLGVQSSAHFNHKQQHLDLHQPQF